MTVKFREIIDREELILDSRNLAEFNKKARVNCNIDNLVDEFVDECVPYDDYETITLLYTLANKIKQIII